MVRSSTRPTGVEFSSIAGSRAVRRRASVASVTSLPMRVNGSPHSATMAADTSSSGMTTFLSLHDGAGQRATVDPELAPGDVGRGVGGQEQHDLPDLLGLTGTPHGY